MKREIFPVHTIKTASQSSHRQVRRKSNPFLRQLCRLKNTLRRVLRALAPTKEGVSPMR